MSMLLSGYKISNELHASYLLADDDELVAKELLSSNVFLLWSSYWLSQCLKATIESAIKILANEKIAYELHTHKLLADELVATELLCANFNPIICYFLTIYKILSDYKLAHELHANYLLMMMSLLLTSYFQAMYCLLGYLLASFLF
jgi:ABC-type glycerol-3-phosphate transport system permease component